MTPFDSLPDDILLMIFKHLTDYELSLVRQVNRRFDSVAKDRELVKNVSFMGCYKLSNECLTKYLLKPVKHHVETLNLNYCYWLTPHCCASIVSKCINLTDLHLLHIQLNAEQLINLLESLKKLRHVSLTIKDVRKFQHLLDRNLEAQKTLQGVRVLTVQMKVKNQPLSSEEMTMQFLAVTSFFEYCGSLEEFHVQEFFTKGIPPYIVNPQIKKLNNLTKIHSMSITDAVDPFARMFFFGALLEICKLPEIQFHTLLQPKVVNFELQRKEQFVTCMKRIEQLRNLDISHTAAIVPSEMYQLDRARNLQYLNVAENSLIDCESLQALADSCPHLTSINLRGCHHLHFARCQEGEIVHSQINLSGLQSLVVNCTALRHINISGVHMHAADLRDTGFTSVCELLALNTQWRSLSLSPCCLQPRSSAADKWRNMHGKRPNSNDEGDSLAKRPRLGVPPLDLMISEEKELGTELGKLVKSCPNVEQFELLGAGFCSVFSKRHISEKMQHFSPCDSAARVLEVDILCIRKWKKLRYLQLSAVPCIGSGDSLREIINRCPKLERLLLAHLGVMPLNTYLDQLAIDLPQAHNLKDLRIEQSYLRLKGTFWDALGQLPSLQRFCLLSAQDHLTQKDSIARVERFVQQATNLVALQLFTYNINQTMIDCNALQSTLFRAHKPERPALNICIHPLSQIHDEKWLSTIPEYHKEGITILSSTVCSRPPHWDIPGLSVS